MVNENTAEILLVEDNPSDVELVLRALKRQQVAQNVVIVRDGEQAVDYVFGRGKYKDRSVDDSPKVIFLDLKLPKLDGFEVLRLIKSDSKTRRIPIVVVTSSKEESDIMRCYDSGANSYIVKPVNYDEFVQCIVETALYWLLMNHTPTLVYH